MRYVWYLALSAGIVASIVWGATRPEREVDDIPDSLANCIAEQVYTHPMNNKWEELRNAIALCDGNGKERTDG